MDAKILGALDHVGLGDTLTFGSLVLRGYFNEAGGVDGIDEQALVFDSPTFNMRASDFEAMQSAGVELEDQVAIEGRGSFRYNGGPYSAGVGRVIILLGKIMSEPI
jgi:hypothetical protein